MATSAAPSSRPLRIFLSSTSQDLPKHRKAVVEVIHGLVQLPVYMETFSASPKDPVETCQKLAASADAVVVIVGLRYGHVPHRGVANESGKSMVWHEVEAAAKVGKPLFCYFAKEKRFQECPSDDRESLAALRSFLQTEIKAVVYGQFSSADDLAKQVAIALGNWLREQALNFTTALRLLDFSANPNPPETLRIAEFLPVLLLDKILGGSAFPLEELDPLLRGEQLTAAQKNLAESIARAQKEAVILEERLVKVRAQERELSALIEILEREPQQQDAYQAALLQHRGELEQFYHAQLQDLDRRQASLHLDRLQLEGVRQSAELFLERLRQEGANERRRLEGEVTAARAKEIVHLLREMRDHSLRLLEEPTSTGHGFLLLLLTALAIPILSGHLAEHATGADMIAQRLFEAAEEAVRRDPQALGRDSLALAVALREGMNKGEWTTTEIGRLLDSVPAEVLRRFGLEQQRLLRFAPPETENFEPLLDPILIAKAAERVERHRVKLADTLSALRAFEAETAAFQEVAGEATQRAARLRQRWSSNVSSLLPRLDDCRRVWTLLTRAAESSSWRGDARRFCECLTAEAKRRLGESPEQLVARCASRVFGLPEAEAVCAEHPVAVYLSQTEKLRRLWSELEARAADLERDGRKLTELPHRRAEEYRRRLRLAVSWAVVPWVGLRRASKAGTLVRHFAPALRSDHRDYRSLTHWGRPWMYGAALVSILGTICLGFAIPPVLAASGPLWAAVLAFAALGYLLNFALWTIQTVRILLLEAERGVAERRVRRREAEKQRLEDRWK